MFFRLIRDFSRDSQAGISLLTVGLLPLFLTLIFVSYDFGRYFMMTRFVSSAAQQTVEWVANRGVFTGEDASTLAKQAFDARMGTNIVATSSLATGITMTSETFTFDPATGVSRLVVKVNYNLALRKTLGLDSVLIGADARIKLKPIFVSIVFSSGEMRSEGNYIYGNPQYLNSPNRGVSWSNGYYTDVIGQPVATRTKPTHNFYMVTALVKELVQRFQYRNLYMNIIPVSATINLNPLDSSAYPPGSREGKLPPWIYSDTGFAVDNTSKTIPTQPYCITNRSLPTGRPTGSFYRDYYEIQASDITSAIPVYNSTTTNSRNFFTDESLLMDSTIIHNTNESGFATTSNPNAFQTRGYPYSSLVNGLCPATNTTPALATFQLVTTTDYTPDAQAEPNPTENQIFWDYMRHYIDPALVSDYAIWGSPNIAFGLQIAYENIGYVQKYGRINNNSNTYDPRSDFLVYVVSDQIGSVKNASGAPIAFWADSDERWPRYSQCASIPNEISDYDPSADEGWSRCFSEKSHMYSSGRQLPSNQTAGETTVPFQFSHFWWDNNYNMTSPACFDNGLYNLYGCDSVYSATTTSVVQHFYNIINYSLDFKFNKDRSISMTKPKAFFIDTGSGKTSDTCQISNKYQNVFYYYPFHNPSPPILPVYPALHYVNEKYCFAYANIIGYTNNFFIYFGINFFADPEGGILALNSSVREGSIHGDMWTEDKTKSMSGFSRIIAYPGASFSNQSNALTYLPMAFYNRSDRMMLNSNPLAAAAPYIFSTNNTAKAAIIAKFAVQASLAAPAIISPY